MHISWRKCLILHWFSKFKDFRFFLFFSDNHDSRFKFAGCGEHNPFTIVPWGLKTCLGLRFVELRPLGQVPSSLQNSLLGFNYFHTYSVHVLKLIGGHVFRTMLNFSDFLVRNFPFLLEIITWCDGASCFRVQIFISWIKLGSVGPKRRCPQIMCFELSPHQPSTPMGPRGIFQ